ncbi:MAG: helix-turn-helix domain-containing protein [Clostridia bacterium]|nr:helix-turn-helix domain-containing protein [Clostridia bacterium]
MEENFTHVGVRIISRLKKLGLKQADLCRKTGLSTTAISQYCTGKQLPNTSALYSLSSALETSMEWLLAGKESLTNKDNDLPRSRFDVYCDGQPLAEPEADIVAMYRLLPEDHREDVYEIVRSKYERLVEKKGSYYSACIEADEAQESGPAEGGEAQSGTA